MTNEPRFSIVIPVYNGEKYLPDTLRSIGNLENTDYELIVVDDGSTDNTGIVAEQAGAQVVTLDENHGPATARNRGAETAKGDILLFTDSDVLLPKALLDGISAAFGRSRADCVQGTFSEVCPFGDFFSQYKNLYNRYVLNQLPDWIDTTYTSITAVKRDAFLRCGGFDEQIRTASVEDRTLGRNLIQSGFRIYLDRTLEVIHNKKLTPWEFVRNQYRRSRDLAKLMLRNREDTREQPAKPSEDGAIRFGTNSAAAMMRLPVLYASLVCLTLVPFFQIASIFVLIFWIHFFYLIAPFMMFLLQQRGAGFVCSAIPVNGLDALVSGLGVISGIVDYIVWKKRY